MEMARTPVNVSLGFLAKTAASLTIVTQTRVRITLPAMTEMVHTPVNVSLGSLDRIVRPTLMNVNPNPARTVELVPTKSIPTLAHVSLGTLDSNVNKKLMNVNRTLVFITPPALMMSICTSVNVMPGLRDNNAKQVLVNVQHMRVGRIMVDVHCLMSQNYFGLQLPYKTRHKMLQNNAHDVLTCAICDWSIRQ